MCIILKVSLNQVPPMKRCYPKNLSCCYQVPRNSAKKLWLRRNEFGSTEEADTASLSGEGLSFRVPGHAKAGQGREGALSAALGWLLCPGIQTTPLSSPSK